MGKNPVIVALIKEIKIESEIVKPAITFEFSLTTYQVRI